MSGQIILLVLIAVPTCVRHAKPPGLEFRREILSAFFSFRAARCVAGLARMHFDPLGYARAVMEAACVGRSGR